MARNNSLSSVFAKSFLLVFGMVVMLLSGCAHDNFTEPEKPLDDKTAPVIKVLHSSVDITGVEEIVITGNELHIGSLLVATWTDNVTKNCRVSMTINGNTVSSGAVPIVSGALKLTVTDDAGNAATASISLRMEDVHPDITVYKPEVNVFGGATLGIKENGLTIADEQVMSWNDKFTPKCKVSVTLGEKELADGDVLSSVGKLRVVVTNNQDKSSTAEIELTCVAMLGLEHLREVVLQVGRETDLLAGITFARGASLVKTELEMDGKRSVIDDPSHFTPETPGQCNIIFTVQGADGTTTEVVVDNLTIKPIDYTEPSIPTADMIGTTYPWYKNLQQSTRDFIYPHLLASYAACNHSKLANRVHIMMGETYEGADNIGWTGTPYGHAYEGYWRIKSLCPGTSIKCVYSYSRFEEYYNEHPYDIFFSSCADDLVGGTRWEQLSGSDAQALRRLLEKDNYFLSVAITNRTNKYYKTYNETIKDGNFYCSASINSKKNNKISVSGYNTSWGNYNFFAPVTDSGKGLTSKMPVGFNITHRNIMMPMPAVIDSDDEENPTTASSFPTAVTSAVVGNAVAVVMANHEGITPVGAMDIIVAKYLREETFQYMDETTNWQLTDGGKWYFLKMDELLKIELLQADKLESLNLHGDEVELPQGKGICYTGRGIQFETDGVRHDLTDAAALQQALKAGNARWYWNRSLFRKQGGTTTADINVYVTDLNGAKFPNLSHTVAKAVN